MNRLTLAVGNYYLVKPIDEIEEILNKDLSMHDYNSSQYSRFIRHFAGTKVKSKRTHAGKTIDIDGDPGFNIHVLFIEKELTLDRDTEYFL